MPAAEEAGFHLGVETEAGVRMRANRQLIGQAVANLIDNAIKYSRGSGPGNAITVAAGCESGGAYISVADRGPGISAADRERVLKRFVRLEDSRTRPGTGLGLTPRRRRRPPAPWRRAPRGQQSGPESGAGAVATLRSRRAGAMTERSKLQQAEAYGLPPARTASDQHSTKRPSPARAATAGNG